MDTPKYAANTWRLWQVPKGSSVPINTGESPDITDRYEVTPFNLTFPVQPVLTKDEKLGPDIRNRELRITGLESRTISIQSAEGFAEARIGQCKNQQNSHRQMEMIVALVEEYPEFMADRWIAEQLYKYIKTRRLTRKSGRRKGYLFDCPFLVGAMVTLLVSEEGVSIDRALGRLVELGAAKSYDSAKKYFYQLRDEKRFRAILIKDPVYSGLQQHLTAL